MDTQELQKRQKLPLRIKVLLSQEKIKEFYNALDGRVYVSFSGGKDSLVLLYLVRSIYPNVPAVFIDTGLEYPEIRDFVKTIPNVIWVKPKMSFYQVLNKYGYPIGSKAQATYIRQVRETKSPYLRYLRLYGKIGSYKVSVANKWRFLINAPFKTSERCCYILKKNPIKKFERISHLRPYLGNMASDSISRRRLYLKNGCNAWEVGKEQSTPLGFWTERDIWEYIFQNRINYCSIYDQGIDRTGCMFCLFGIQYDKGKRFKVMKKLHPKIYEYCMSNLKIRFILDYLIEHGIDLEEF